MALRDFTVLQAPNSIAEASNMARSLAWHEGPVGTGRGRAGL